MKYVFFSFILALTLVACKHSHDHSKDGKNETSTEASADIDQSGPEYTSAYICPMHCTGSGSDEAGKCPVCGMDYVVNEDHQSDGHNHDDHEGHDHDDHDHNH